MVHVNWSFFKITPVSLQFYEAVNGRRWLEKGLMFGGCMGLIRYAVAGDPIEQSLSPLLFVLVSNHLGLEEVSSPDIVPASTIENALAWGYAGAVPVEIEWYHTSAPLGKFRSKTLIEKAIVQAQTIESVDASLHAIHPFSSPQPKIEGPNFKRFDFEEIWMNLTTPLKHQLQSMAVSNLDCSDSIQSVNALRWDGQGWWCMSTDGIGMAAVLLHRGVGLGSCVGMIGGGSAARSFAHAWTTLGGHLNFLGGRREIELDDVLFSNEKPICVVEFEEHELVELPQLRFKASYDLSIDLERIMQPDNHIYDGRWLLVAQHLEAWRTLWAPHLAQQLPSLEVLLARLIECEKVLRSYKR